MFFIIKFKNILVKIVDTFLILIDVLFILLFVPMFLMEDIVNLFDGWKDWLAVSKRFWKHSFKGVICLPDVFRNLWRGEVKGLIVIPYGELKCVYCDNILRSYEQNCSNCHKATMRKCYCCSGIVRNEYDECPNCGVSLIGQLELPLSF